MTSTAKEIQDFALAQLTALCNFPDRSKASVYRELAEESGLSAIYIETFHRGRNSNLTTDSLDRLMAAIKKSLRKAAA